MFVKSRQESYDDLIKIYSVDDANYFASKEFLNDAKNYVTTQALRNFTPDEKRLYKAIFSENQRLLTVWAYGVILHREELENTLNIQEVIDTVVDIDEILASEPLNLDPEPEPVPNVLPDLTDEAFDLADLFADVKNELTIEELNVDVEKKTPDFAIADDLTSLFDSDDDSDDLEALLEERLGSDLGEVEDVIHKDIHVEDVEMPTEPIEEFKPKAAPHAITPVQPTPVAVPDALPSNTMACFVPLPKELNEALAMLVKNGLGFTLEDSQSCYTIRVMK